MPSSPVSKYMDDRPTYLGCPYDVGKHGKSESQNYASHNARCRTEVSTVLTHRLSRRLATAETLGFFKSSGIKMKMLNHNLDRAFRPNSGTGSPEGR